MKKKRKILGIFKKCYFFAHFPKTGMPAAVAHSGLHILCDGASSADAAVASAARTRNSAYRRCRLSADILCDGESDPLRKV